MDFYNHLMTQSTMSFFSNCLPINEQLTTPDQRHLDQDQYPYYKHCDYYPVSAGLQPYFGTNWTLLAIYHCREDIDKQNILANFNQSFGNGKLAVGIPYIYLVEESHDGQLEQIHLLPVLSGLEIGSKHYMFAQELGILSRVVEAGELMLKEDGTIEFNDLTGTFMNFDAENYWVLKSTPINQYFQKLCEINGLEFKRVRKALVDRSITLEDISRFSSSCQVFCNVPFSEADKLNWQLVGQDVLDDTQGIPLGDILSQHFDEIVMRPEVNKILSASQLRKQKPSHFARPLGNFLQSPTVERARDLAIYWPKIIAGSEIPRRDFEQILDEFKQDEVPLTVKMFMGPSGNIFVKELPDVIKQMLD
jgi:hypothetical protein